MHLLCYFSQARPLPDGAKVKVRASTCAECVLTQEQVAEAVAGAAGSEHPNVRRAAQTVRQLRNWGFDQPLDEALVATILLRQQDTADVIRSLVTQLHIREKHTTLSSQGGNISSLHSERIFVQSPDFCSFYHRVRGREYTGWLDYKWHDARIKSSVKGTHKKRYVVEYDDGYMGEVDRAHIELIALHTARTSGGALEDAEEQEQESGRSAGTSSRKGALDSSDVANDGRATYTAAFTSTEETYWTLHRCRLEMAETTTVLQSSYESAESLRRQITVQRNAIIQSEIAHVRNETHIALLKRTVFRHDQRLYTSFAKERHAWRTYVARRFSEYLRELDAVSPALLQDTQGASIGAAAASAANEAAGQGAGSPTTSATARQARVLLAKWNEYKTGGHFGDSEALPLYLAFSNRLMKQIMTKVKQFVDQEDERSLRFEPTPLLADDETRLVWRALRVQRRTLADIGLVRKAPDLTWLFPDEAALLARPIDDAKKEGERRFLAPSERDSPLIDLLMEKARGSVCFRLRPSEQVATRCTLRQDGWGVHKGEHIWLTEVMVDVDGLGMGATAPEMAGGSAQQLISAIIYKEERHEHIDYTAIYPRMVEFAVTKAAAVHMHQPRKWLKLEFPAPIKIACSASDANTSLEDEYWIAVKTSDAGAGIARLWGQNLRPKAKSRSAGGASDVSSSSGAQRAPRVPLTKVMSWIGSIDARPKKRPKNLPSDHYEEQETMPAAFALSASTHRQLYSILRLNFRSRRRFNKLVLRQLSALEAG